MPIYVHSCPKCGPFETFRYMNQSAADAQCPQCGEFRPKVLTAPRIKVKEPGEKPTDSVKRVTGESRKHCDIPFQNEQGEYERVYLDSGSKAEQKARVVDAVMRTKHAKKHNVSRSDVDVPNL